MVLSNKKLNMENYLEFKRFEIHENFDGKRLGCCDLNNQD